MSFVWVLFAAVAHASGGTVEGTLTVTKDGKPGSVKNALVFIRGYRTDPPNESPRMSQSGRAFDHVVLPVIFRTRVTFSNDELDEGIYHHVFSPTSTMGKIESPKYKPKEKAYVSPVLSYEGPFDVFCDIHKEMISTIYVVPNDRFTLLSTAEGASAPYKIEGIRPGSWTIVAWHRSAQKPTELKVEVVEGKTTRLDLVIDGESGLEKLLKSHQGLGKSDYREPKPDGGATGELGDGW